MSSNFGPSFPDYFYVTGFSGTKINAVSLDLICLLVFPFTFASIFVTELYTVRVHLLDWSSIRWQSHFFHKTGVENKGEKWQA